MEPKSKRGQQCDPNQTSGFFRALKEKSTVFVCMPDNGGAWIQLYTPYRTAHYMASDPCSRDRKKHGKCIVSVCMACTLIRSRASYFWKDRKIYETSSKNVKGTFNMYKRNVQKYHCYFGGRCLCKGLKKQLFVKKLILFEVREIFFWDRKNNGKRKMERKIIEES